MSTGLTTATARTVLAPLAGNRAELVAQRLGDAIRVGLLLDGERLPAEAELAGQLGVSTVTLREALTLLRAEKLIVTRRGRGGGSFVRAPKDRKAPLRRFSLGELRDLGDERAAISGAAARLAAERALPEEIQRLQEQVERLRTAASASERRRANTELTLAIAAAAQSPRLTHEEARLRSEVGDLLKLGEIDHDALVRDQEQLVQAIAKRKPNRARKLAERHVAWETERLIALRLDMLRHTSDVSLERVSRELEHIFAALHALADGFDARRRAELDIASIQALIGELVTGAGIICAPGVLADAPLWLEWWWTGARAEPEALRVNLDPAAPDFYDYTLADWYATPERTHAPRMAGPYVDYACTNAYALTLSVPIVRDGIFKGIAAADVLVSSLEAWVVPALDRPASLTNADGRVIVSNVPGVTTGERIAVDGARPVAALPSWLIVIHS